MVPVGGKRTHGQGHRHPTGGLPGSANSGDVSVTDHPPTAAPRPRTTDPGPGRHPGSGVADRTTDASVAPMDGSSAATRMISETGVDTRSWIAVEYVA